MIFQFGSPDIISQKKETPCENIMGSSKTDLNEFRLVNYNKITNEENENSEKYLFEESESFIEEDEIDLASESIELELINDGIPLTDFSLLENESEIEGMNSVKLNTVKETLDKLQGSELLEHFIHEKKQISVILSGMLDGINRNDSEGIMEQCPVADLSVFLDTQL